MKKCQYCGAELSDDSQFCTECGKQLAQDNKCPNCGANSQHSLNKVLIGLIALIVIGGVWFFLKKPTGNTEPKQETVDSVKQENEKVQTSTVTIDKKQELIPFEVVLDIYKRENKSYALQVLKEYGYTLYKVHDGVGMWTKNVELEEVDTYNGGTSYSPKAYQGSSAGVSESSSYFSFSITVYSQTDYDKWIKQLEAMGYKYQTYENPLEEDGWTPMGAHGNLFRQYVDSKGNSIEFMKEDEGRTFTVYSVTIN